MTLWREKGFSLGRCVEICRSSETAADYIRLVDTENHQCINKHGNVSRLFNAGHKG